MRLKMRDKGAALVSVLIATTFMTVLITTLLYMSYMNYLTKSMRYMSTDNFYTDEFALDDLATSMQQVAANNVSGTNGKPDLIAAVSGDGGSTWDAGLLKGLIKVASQEANIEVKTADGKSPTMTVGESVVTLHNVKLESTTKKGEYVSNIVSDITIAFPAQPKQSYGIYDFSLITDQQVEVVEGQVAMGGCLYCRQQDGQDYAIQVDQKGLLDLSCPVGVVIGNIVVKNGGTLCVSGDLYVTGNITVEGAMFVTGNVKYGGSLSGTDRIKGKPGNVTQYGSSEAERNAWVDDLVALAGNSGEKGFTESMVNTHVKLLKENSNTNWFYADDTSYGDIYMFQGVKFGFNDGKKSKNPLSDGSGRYSRAIVLYNTDTINDGDLKDALILCKDVDNIRGDLSRSTIIMPEKEKLKFDILASSTYLGKMTEEGYEMAKDILFDANTQYAGDGNGNIKYTSGYLSTVKTQSGFFEFTTSGSDFENGVLHYYGKDQKNVLPIGNLITPDAEFKVAKLMSLATGSTVKPEDTYIIYSNWYKE